LSYFFNLKGRIHEATFVAVVKLMIAPSIYPINCVYGSRVVSVYDTLFSYYITDWANMLVDLAFWPGDKLQRSFYAVQQYRCTPSSCKAHHNVLRLAHKSQV